MIHSGFACIVGRPNAGKSTLTNALVGAKVAIASSKPQTTRHAIRGIVNRPDAQLVLIDTPGLHRPRTLLGQRLNDLVYASWAEVDVIGVCLPANQRVGPGDKFLLGEIAKLPKRPALVALATKSDLVSPARMAEHLLAIAALAAPVLPASDSVPPLAGSVPPLADSGESAPGAALAIPSGSEPGAAQAVPSQSARAVPALEWAAVIPVSALTGDQVDIVSDELVKLLPEGPRYYPDGEITDEPDRTLVAELIREAALEGAREELPHSITVEVDEMGLREGRSEDHPLLDIYASLIVERDSQKGIIIGHRGERLREIGAAARRQISALMGTPVYLDLHVKVLKDWQRNPKFLNRLGF
ncbi:MAG: GTPase Era [Propionibacteriaceae bacterium]|jgi:GTP-binding protein Era|nr:GTPase Era [Propionibacteriaceae bacterium]